jgi:drug/metabolite transporter (DMT)-like permease
VPFPAAGETFALLAPLCWASAVILFKRSTGDFPPAAMNLFKNVTALVLLSVTLAVTGTSVPADRAPMDWLRIAASGVLGLAVADTFLFGALARLGAARMAIVDTVYAPTVVVLSWAFLGESLGAGFLVGALAVVTGVAVATIDRAALAREAPGELRLGVILGVAAIMGTATGVVLVKPALEGADLVEATWSRMAFGVLGQAAWLAIRGQLGQALVALHPRRGLSSLLPASFLGTYVSLLLWLAGFKWAPASVAAVLNQLATIYILVLARVFLGEPLTPRRVVGAGLAVAGALAVVVGAR